MEGREMRDAGEHDVVPQAGERRYVLERRIEELRAEARDEPDEQAESGAQSQYNERLGKRGLLRQTGRVEHTEPLPLPPALQAARHLGIELPAQQGRVV